MVDRRRKNRDPTDEEKSRAEAAYASAPKAREAWALPDYCIVILTDGRRLRFGWNLTPRLAAATPAERAAVELSPPEVGYGLRWPSIDEDLRVGRLVELADQREGREYDPYWITNREDDYT